MSNRPFVETLTHLGVQRDTPPSVAKYVILTNTVALVAAAMSSLYFVINLWFQSATWLQLGPPSVSTLMYVAPLWLNRHGSYWLATTLMCVATFATQIVFVWMFGYASGNHFFVLPLLAGVPLLYPPKHWKSAAVLVFFSLAMFTAIVFGGERISPLEELSPEVTASYNTLALVFTAGVLAFISYLSHRRMVIAEGLAEKRSQELAHALSELKESQAQMIHTANQAVLGSVTAGLLHEVNTPLGSIRSAADTMRVAVERCSTFVRGRSDASSSEARSVLGAIDVAVSVRKTLDEAAERISTLVQGLRQFVGLDEAERKPFDVRRGLDGAVDLLEPAVEGRIDFVRSYPESLTEVVGSKAKLNRALFSVLENAVQAIDGSGEIRVSVRESGAGVEIEITDNGRGIPAERMDEIFQVGLIQRGGRVGMRLGLPMSKRSVDEMGGQFELESVQGDGTTVRITLPTATS